MAALLMIISSFPQITEVKAATVNDTLYVDTSYTFDVATTKYADPNAWVIGHENPIRRRSDNQPVYCIQAHIHFDDNSNVIGYDDDGSHASLGRHCGDIAIEAACATGSEIVLVPEVKWFIDEVAARLNKQMAKGNYRSTIVVAEGCWESMEPFDMYSFLTSNGERCYEGEPISANRLATILKYKCGKAEIRSTVIGYTQRGALPVARDSAFAFEAGHLAVKLLHDGISNQVIGTRLGRVFHMGIQEALKEKREFRYDLYKLVNDIRD